MRWRRWLLPAAAVLCVPVAIALALFAVDVLRVSGSVEEDDVRFQARPTLRQGCSRPGVCAGSGRVEGGRAGGRPALSPRRLALRPCQPEQHDGVPLAPTGGAAGEPRAEAHRRQPGGDRSPAALAAAQPPGRRGDEPLRRRPGRPLQHRSCVHRRVHERDQDRPGQRRREVQPRDRPARLPPPGRPGGCPRPRPARRARRRRGRDGSGY